MGLLAGMFDVHCGFNVHREEALRGLSVMRHGGGRDRADDGGHTLVPLTRHFHLRLAKHPPGQDELAEPALV